MRIVSGLYGGRTLVSPPPPTRPTQDRVRQILFDILGGRVEGGAVLDLYAGSGALGLEALSRGAARAVFVERAEKVRSVLERNLAALGAHEVSEVVASPVEVALPKLLALGASFRWIFADPPYENGAAQTLLAWLGEEGRALLEPEGGLVLETERTGPLPERQGTLVRYRQRPVGGTNLHFFRGEELCG